MQTAPDLYFDAVSQIHMQRWSYVRVVLLGDAGYCPALLSGQALTLVYPGWRTERGSGRSSASVSPVRTGLETHGQPCAKKGWISGFVPGSHNTFGPVGTNALESAAAP